MNFRQRVAWILVVMLLAVSAAVAYYLFENSVQYGERALDYANRQQETLENSSSEQLNWWESFKRHVSSLPFWSVVVVLGVPYLAVFFSLILCATKNDPRAAVLSVWTACCSLLSLSSKESRKGANRSETGLHGMPLHQASRPFEQTIT